ncbi:MAG: hypothetical protein GVY36_13400 [Verrucomicrobia bacterium]|jgi:hypothetical protein|nr:hypothetical protein [Verrucomicrobiota bacterium]
MKPKSLLLYLGVWSLSLAIAYYLGSRGQSESVSDAAESSASIPEIIPTSIKSSSERAPTISEPTQNALKSYLGGESVSFQDALVDVARLSGENSRLLLADAFALPVSDPNRPRLIEKLLSQLAKTEPLTALQIASEITSLRDSEDARAAILEVWGRTAPAAAIAWANDALAGEPTRARSTQLTAIFQGYATTNPQAAFAQALALDENMRLKTRLLGEVIEAQIQSGSLEVAKMSVESVTDPELRESLRNDLIDEWAEFDPIAASTYLETLGEDATSRLKRSLVSEWAESDPAAAAAWLGQLDPDDPAVARASAAIIRQWTRFDLAASAEWLNSLPDSPDLDRAVASYAFRAAEEDPAAAMTWAGSIKNNRRRSWMMERVAGTWKEQDAETFQSYLDSADLSEAQRGRLENANTRGRGRWR